MLDVASALDQIDLVKVDEKVSSLWYILFDAKGQLEALFSQSIYASHLRISRQKANELHTFIISLLGDDPHNNHNLITELDLWLLKSRRDHFKTVFLSELSTLPAFLVGMKESYDINLLVDEGAKLFPATLSVKCPESIRDAREVGRAIAFELSTAAGFHIFRVVESVLKRYWDHVSKNARPKLETIGSYAAELEKGKIGDAKIYELLKQLSKLHRNPLIHPEVILDVGEEIEILGISRSVVGAMLRVLPDVPTTTSTALPAPAAQ